MIFLKVHRLYWSWFSFPAQHTWSYVMPFSGPQRVQLSFWRLERYRRTVAFLRVAGGPTPTLWTLPPWRSWFLWQRYGLRMTPEALFYWRLGDVLCRYILWITMTCIAVQDPGVRYLGPWAQYTFPQKEYSLNQQAGARWVAIFCCHFRRLFKLTGDWLPMHVFLKPQSFCQTGSNCSEIPVAPLHCRD